MKPFEETFTAWVDGALADDELAHNPESAAEKVGALKLRGLLREHPTAPPLANADFFNLQLMQRIESTLPKPQAAGAEKAAWAWPLSRLVWAAAFCLLVAFVFFKVWIPVGSGAPTSDYFAQVIESWPADDSISATTLYNPEDNVTVLWLDGLDYIPAG